MQLAEGIRGIGMMLRGYTFQWLFTFQGSLPSITTVLPPW
ncbi:hypothetical protein QFZ84_000923 [Pseudomonas fluorescens]